MDYAEPLWRGLQPSSITADCGTIVAHCILAGCGITAPTSAAQITEMGGSLPNPGQLSASPCSYVLRLMATLITSRHYRAGSGRASTKLARLAPLGLVKVRTRDPRGHAHGGGLVPAGALTEAIGAVRSKPGPDRVPVWLIADQLLVFRCERRGGLGAPLIRRVPSGDLKDGPELAGAAVRLLGLRSPLRRILTAPTPRTPVPQPEAGT